MNSPTPLVSITIPTGNRRIFVARAVMYAMRQTWPKIEIIIVDGSARSVPDQSIEKLKYAGRFIRYERVDPSTTLGWRRNRAAELATGEVLVHFDDDDWHSRKRVERQVRTLLDGADITQTSDFFAWSLPTGQARRWPQQGSEGFAHGASLAYWRRVWEREPFADVGLTTPAGRSFQSAIDCNRNSDSDWVRWWRRQGARVVDSLDRSLYVYLLHPRTTMGFSLQAARDDDATALVRAMWGDEDAQFYAELAELLPLPARPDPLDSLGFRARR